LIKVNHGREEEGACEEEEVYRRIRVSAPEITTKIRGR